MVEDYSQVTQKYRVRLHDGQIKAVDGDKLTLVWSAASSSAAEVKKAEVVLAR